MADGLRAGAQMAGDLVVVINKLGEIASVFYWQQSKRDVTALRQRLEEHAARWCK